MSDTEIRIQAQQFTRGLLGRQSPKDTCYIVSIALIGYLSMLGVNCYLVEGEVSKHHHFWIAMNDGRIIDATAEQFLGRNKKKYRNIWLQKAPANYQQY